MLSTSLTSKNSGFTILKLAILVSLCLQTSGYCVFLSVSKTLLHEEYSNTEVLILSEIIKLVVSGIIVLRSNEEANTGTRALCRLGSLLLRGRKLVVLVVLYSIANIIPFFAVHYIGAPAFTVIMQMKVFTTAGFSTMMLSRQYSATKWRALILLVIGVILVSSPIINKAPITPESVDSAGAAAVPSMELLGLCLTLLQATISGFTSVYFEGMLKEDNSSIWERNFQLAFYSIFCMALINLGESVAPLFLETIGLGTPTNDDGHDSNRLFAGWTVLAVVLAILQGVGGLLVAATLKYADAVLKCFATAVSIIITSVVGYFFLGNKIDLFVALGFITTVLSILNYTLDHQQIQEGVIAKQRDDEMPAKAQSA